MVVTVTGFMRECRTRHTETVSTPEDLLAEAPLEAAVAALAERNHHHLAEMTPPSATTRSRTGARSPSRC